MTNENSGTKVKYYVLVHDFNLSRNPYLFIKNATAYGS